MSYSVASGSLGILGLGVSVPSTVRGNDWWPRKVVQRWQEQARAAREKRPPVVPDAGPDTLAIVAAMEAEADDPFRGVVERPVAADHVRAIDLEAEAARRALANSGLAADDIGFVLGTSLVPDHLIVENLAALHHRLGLRSDCMTVSAGVTCSGFMAQMTLARALVGSGFASYGLLVQSSLMSRVLDWQAPYSPVFGDGASAVVVGAVEHPFGVRGNAQFTDGQYSEAVVAGVRGKRWFEDGSVTWFPNDAAHVRGMLFSAPRRASQSVAAALRHSELSPSGIDVYVGHQGTSWLPRVTQLACGLSEARRLESFAHTGSLTVANIPYLLARAAAGEELVAGDTVAMFSGGAGETYGAMILRWAARGR